MALDILHSVHDFVKMLADPDLIRSMGYLGITVIVFAESGLLIGFFLPGDSLLFTAGFLASQGIFHIWILCALSFIAAVAGDSVGYAFGKHIGARLFTREDSWLFHKKNLEKAQSFYDKYGVKTIILARFLPIVRTFAPIVAGAGKMHYRTFVIYNIIGGFIWSVGITLAGYFLGQAIPNVDRYLLPIILVIVIVSVVPSAIHVLLEMRKEKKVAENPSVTE